MTEPVRTTGPTPPVAHLRDGSPVAAWMFKAKPEVWDVIGAIRARLADPEAPGIDSWEMAASYRVDLVAPGHPCVLWVTGGRHAPTTGVWAVGEVVSPPWLEPDSLDGRPRFSVGLDLRLLAAPVRLSELLDDGRFVRAEIVRAPRVSSPVALTGDELAAIEDQLPPVWSAHPVGN